MPPTLQSEGVLRIATLGRDATTGRQQTQHHEVEGPVAMLLTTTADMPDTELANRYIILFVCEHPEQTATRSHTKARGQLSREAASATPGTRRSHARRSSGSAYHQFGVLPRPKQPAAKFGTHRHARLPVAPLQGALSACSLTQGAPHARRPWAVMWHAVGMRALRSDRYAVDCSRRLGTAPIELVTLIMLRTPSTTAAEPSALAQSGKSKRSRHPTPTTPSI